MNQQLTNDFINKIKQTVDELYKELIASKIDTKEAFTEIKLIKTKLCHL